MVEVCIRLHVDLKEGICFMSTIREVPKKNLTGILQFNGKLAERD